MKKFALGLITLLSISNSYAVTCVEAVAKPYCETRKSSGSGGIIFGGVRKYKYCTVQIRIKKDKTNEAVILSDYAYGDNKREALAQLDNFIQQVLFELPKCEAE